MKLFAAIFFGIGFILSVIGLTWLYIILNQSETPQFSEALIGPLILSFVGLVFAFVGGGVFYFQAKQKKRRELLLRTGRKVKAVVVKMYENTFISVNNRHPLVVECEADIIGKKQIFKSHNLWNSPQLDIGKEVNVFIDTRDNTNYWVDAGD